MTTRNNLRRIGTLCISLLLICCTVISMNAVNINGATVKTPAKVTNLQKGTAENNKYPITWNKAENAKKYQIYRCATQNGNYSLLKTVTTTKYTATVASGKTFYYKVRGVNGSKYGAFSTALKISTPAEINVAQVTGLISTASENSQYILSWSAAKNAKKYQIYRCATQNGKYSLLKTVTTVKYTVTVAAGKTYYYKVRGVNGSKYGAFSTALKISTPAEINVAQVTGLKSTASANNKYLLSWSAAKNAKKYQIYRCATQNGNYSLLKTVTTTKYTATVASGKTFYYKVRGVNGSKYGAFSTDLKISTPAEITVAQVTGLVSTASENSQYILSWSAAENAQEYQIYYSAVRDGEYTILQTVTTTEYTETIPLGKTYYFKVCGINGSKCGDFSDVLEIENPIVDIAKITDIEKTYLGHYNYQLNWPSVENAVSYLIYSADSQDGDYILCEFTATGEFSVYAPPGTEKYYKICGVNGNNVGEFSEIIDVCTSAETAIAKGVPSYWNEEILTSEDTFNSTPGNASFIYFTDSHWNANTKYSPYLVNYFYKKLNTPLAVFGGDIIEGTYNSSTDAINEIKDFMGRFDSSVNLMVSTGNHDYNTSAFDADPLTDRQLYSLVYKRETSFATVAQYGRCAYTDDDNAKVRYISLYFDAHLNNNVPQYGKDVANSYPTASELKWLKKTVQAEKLTDDWTIVLFTHGYWDYQLAGIEVSPTQAGTKFGNYLLTLESDPDTKAEIGCWIVGHTHRDLTEVIDNETDSIRVICVNTDSYLDGNNTRFSGCLGGQIMTAGHDTEQVIELVKLDTENKMIHLIRVGAGEDRHYSY